MMTRRTNVGGLECTRKPRQPSPTCPIFFCTVPIGTDQTIGTRSGARSRSHPYPSWITCSFQMPFRVRCSHPPLQDRDLGNRRCTRTCLWAPILASRTNGLQRFRPKTLAIRGREDRERITSPSSMAAVTTPTTQRRHRIHFRMTGSLLACECFSAFVFNIGLSASEPLPVGGGGEEERERDP